MRAGSRAVTAVFILSLARSVSGELPKGATLVPPVFYPSDPVELRIALPSGWEGGEARAPKSSETLDILSAEVLSPQAGKYELRLRFIAWKPGILEIPAFGAGQASFGPYELRADSFIARTGEGMAPPRPPALLRGTRIMIASIFAVIGALALLGTGFASFVLPWLGRIGRKMRERKPYARFAHDMRVALKRRDDPDGRLFYDYLSRAFRRYSRYSLGLGIDSLTPGEMAFRGVHAYGPRAAELAEILGRSDAVRFASRSTAGSERFRDASAIYRIVGEMEAEREGL
jgi:hypothetical protein